MLLSKSFHGMLWSKLRTNNLVWNIIKNRNASVKKLSAEFETKLSNGPSLSQFVTANITEKSKDVSSDTDLPPYIYHDSNTERKVYVETYGCQMNFSDTEVVLSILRKAGFQITADLSTADVIFIMTCAIREGAEQKIWKRLKYLKNLKSKNIFSSNSLKVGVLGCMAERLKHRMLEKEKLVDIVAGPDSYKDLPNLLSLADEGQKAVNVMLSADETYADILPVRINSTSKTAFVSIMRGCDNMCSYCIVPFTRGRERSRPVSSILDEVKFLSDQGIKEITLLGQNVNSYRDVSESSINFSISNSPSPLAPGFRTIYKNRSGGLRFADLLDKVAEINPEIRIRFTSPHPKDFPDEVLHVINDKPNICKLLHLPAQSGNTAVLERMRRGYSREAYLNLVDHIREIIPGVAFTSDFICGFCDETEEEHQDTLSLMKKVKYEFAYVFPYSMREAVVNLKMCGHKIASQYQLRVHELKTKAHRQLTDNVPEEVKKRRADEASNTFRNCALELHEKEIGNNHLIQILGASKRSNLEWSGRNDWNTKVIYPQIQIPIEEGSQILRTPSPGDYVVVKINGCTSQVLKGMPLYLTSLKEFCDKRQNKLYEYS